MPRPSLLLALCPLLAAVPVQAEQALQVSAEPPSVVLGSTDSVKVMVSGAGGPLRAHASVGSLELEDAGAAGMSVWRWTPPAERFPQVALLLFWEAEPEARKLALLKLPLSGRMDLVVDTEPEATVRVQVGGAVFGPARASAEGKAKVAIEVPPSTKQARVLAEVQRQRTTRTVKLEVPESSPLTAAVLSDELGPEGGWLAIAHAEQLDPSSVRAEVSDGRLALVRSGRDFSLYRLLPAPTARQMRITVHSSEPGAEDILLSVRVAEGPTPAKAAVAAAGLGGPRFSTWLGLGGFLSSGENRGPLAELGAGYSPPWFQRRLWFEVGLGYQASGANVPVTGLGELHSSLRMFPLTLAARMKALQLGRVHLAGRAGVGALLFRHRTEASFQANVQEAGVDPALFVAAQAALPLQRLEPFVELRGAWARVSAPHVLAQAGGVSALLGLRYLVP